MHIMNNNNALYPLIAPYNWLYIKALSKVLPYTVFLISIIFISLYSKSIQGFLKQDQFTLINYIRLVFREYT